MQHICRKIVEKWDAHGYSIAEMAARTGLSESTLRRFRAGDRGVTFDTAATVAEAVGVTFDAADTEPGEGVPELAILPGGANCPNNCPARQSMGATIGLVRELYEADARRVTDLYERSIAEKNGRLNRYRIVTASLALLSAALVGFIIYLVFVDFPHPNFGLLQYDSDILRMLGDLMDAYSMQPLS